MSNLDIYNAMLCLNDSLREIVGALNRIEELLKNQK